jgi:hypothetical protein
MKRFLLLRPFKRLDSGRDGEIACREEEKLDHVIDPKKGDDVHHGGVKVAVRRRSFSTTSLSRSISKIRKNATLRTTLHSFPDNDLYCNSLPITVLKCQEDADYPLSEEDDDEHDAVLPLQSCLKVKTLEESLLESSSTSGRFSRKIQKIEEVTTEEEEKEEIEIGNSSVIGNHNIGRSTCTAGQSQASAGVCVSFSTVEIREHKICLDENHATTSRACIVPDGVALTLDWSVVRTHCVDVQEFQRMKGPIKDIDGLRLSYEERYIKLMEWDVSDSDIKDAKQRQHKLLRSTKGVRRIVAILKTKL